MPPGWQSTPQTAGFHAVSKSMRRDGMSFTCRRGYGKPVALYRKRDFTLNGIFSKDIGTIHMDANLNATRLGSYDVGTGRIQTGLSASFSTPVSEK